jgi:hypothetical protein
MSGRGNFRKVKLSSMVMLLAQPYFQKAFELMPDSPGDIDLEKIQCAKGGLSKYPKRRLKLNAFINIPISKYKDNRGLLKGICWEKFVCTLEENCETFHRYFSAFKPKLSPSCAVFCHNQNFRSFIHG